MKHGINRVYPSQRGDAFEGSRTRYGLECGDHVKVFAPVPTGDRLKDKLDADERLET